MMNRGMKILETTSDIKELVQTLERLIIELENLGPYGELWVNWMTKGRQLIQRNKFDGVLYVISAYHCINSINDDIANTDGEALSQKIYYLTKKIKIDFESRNFPA